jgi:nitrogen regulatory protein PII
MKRIEAWIQRRELEDVTAVLRDAGVMRATVTKVRSVGTQVAEKGNTLSRRFVLR